MYPELPGWFAPRLAPWLALFGVGAIWSPLVFLCVVELNWIPGGVHFGVDVLIGLWAAALVLGFAMMMLGIAGLAGSGARGVTSRSRVETGRVALFAGIALLLGFAVLVSTIAFVESCESPCIGGGGVMGGTRLIAASCGAVCALGIGPSQLLWPVQLVAVAIVLDVIGGLLAAVAVGRAISESRVHRLTIAG